MQRIQLYIEDHENNFKLVDLFKDEIIELTSTIQDVRDIGKVFTDFSQTFTVPASDTNNKIFRHFYNFNITGGAFDSRKKKRARIEINYLPFRKGKIFLNSVKMRNNKPHAYEIIFYGETVTLKDLIGDDELKDLDFSDYNHSYDETNVRNGLTSGLDLNSQTDSIIYPLITSKKRLYYDSSPMTNADPDGNLYHDSGSPDELRGLRFTDLKPAIRVMHMIEAIETKYGIRFTRDFFNIEDEEGLPKSPAFKNLYFWINNKKGEFNDIDDDENFLFSLAVTGYASSDPSNLVTLDGDRFTVNLVKDVEYDFRLDLTVSDQTIPYTVILKNITRGTELKKDAVGDGTIAIDYLNVSSTSSDVFEWEIRSVDELTINSATFRIAYRYPLESEIEKTYTTTTNGITVFNILVENRMPNMKVIDFLTGLFKMFNLTAYFISDEDDDDYNTNNKPTIYVDTLDNFYADAVNNKLGSTIDIDEYLDISSHVVDTVLPYTDVKFEYQETKTVLMDHHTEEFGEVFGNAEFNVKREYPDQIDRGKKYEIKIPFSHFKYERLLNLNRNVSSRETLIQWGYCAGGDYNFEGSESATADASPIPPKGDYETVSIQPLLFYGLSTLTSTTKINWISSDPPTGLTNYYKPSNANTVSTSFAAPSHNLNFDQEFNEWERINYADQSNSLYNSFYKSYVEDVFDPTKRMFKVKAFLPANILVNYKLNHQIKIQDNIFRINSITTNINTGESTLELLNIKPSDAV